MNHYDSPTTAKGRPTTFVTPGIEQPQQGTVLAPVQPIAPRALLDTQNRLIDVYAEQAKQAAKVQVLPADGSSAPRGYSSAGELQARNRRFYFTVGAMVGVAAFAMWGIVSVGHAAGFVGDNWTLPLWIALTGVSAFLSIRSVHGSEQRLTPESIELARAENQFAVDHMDAETRQLAIRYAARLDLERLRLEREQQRLQREANHRLALETQARIGEQMTRHTQPQHTMNRVHTYRPPAAQQAQPPQRGGWEAQEAPAAAQDSTPAGYDLAPDADALQPVYEPEPVTVIDDPARLALLNFVADLYLDRDSSGTYRRMDAGGVLKTGVTVPWSQRGGMSKEQREQTQEILRQVTPWVMRYDDEARRWRVNVRHYRRAGEAVAAIDAAYTPAAK